MNDLCLTTEYFRYIFHTSYQVSVFKCNSYPVKNYCKTNSPYINAIVEITSAGTHKEGVIAEGAARIAVQEVM
jgi:hypothetical protein